jgi:hypothetical protein
MERETEKKHELKFPQHQMLENKKKKNSKLISEAFFCRELFLNLKMPLRNRCGDSPFANRVVPIDSATFVIAISTAAIRTFRAIQTRVIIVVCFFICFQISRSVDLVIAGKAFCFEK